MDAECRRALSGSGAWTSSEDLFAGCLRQSKCACCGVDLAAQPPGVGGGPDEAGDVAGSGGCDLTAWTSTDMAHEPGASSIVPMAQSGPSRSRRPSLTCFAITCPPPGPPPTPSPRPPPPHAPRKP